MSMPSGESPQHALQYYHYQQSQQLVPHGRDATWHVDGTALAWMWGFIVVLVVLLWAWVTSYRSTRHKGGIFPVDTWGGFTSEQAGPATRFFFIVVLPIVVLGTVMVVTHLIYGQKF
jgi:hypothetical protein